MSVFDIINAGGVAEWLKAPVLKTDHLRVTVRTQHLRNKSWLGGRAQCAAPMEAMTVYRRNE